MRTKHSQLGLAILVASCVCLATAILYWHSLGQPFQFDDQLFLRDDNVRLARWRAFVLPPVPRFLTWLTFLAQYQVSGVSPTAYHAFNLVFHTLNSALVFFLLALFLGKPRDAPGRESKVGLASSSRLLLAGVGAAVFALHPLQSESVLLAYQRSTLLAAFFSFLSLLCWLQSKGDLESAKRGSAASNLATVFLFLAVSAKESAVVVPLLFWIHDGLLHHRWKPSRRLLFLLGVGGLTGFGMALEGAESGQVATSQGLAGGLVYAATQVRVVWLYLGLLVGIGSLNVDHQVPAQATPWDPIWWLAAAGLGGVLWIFWRWRRRRPKMTFFGLVFFLFLLPSSSFLPSPDFAFEHRLYASMLGVAGVGSLAVLELTGWLTKVLDSATARRWQVGGVALLVCVGLSLMAASARERMEVWRDPVTLWRDAASKSPDKYRPNFNVGALLLESRPAEAERYLSRAIEIDPSQPLAYRSLGEARLRQGQDQEAESLWKQALLLNPDDFDTLLALGKLARRGRRYFQALNRFEAAERLRPDDWEVQYQLAGLQQDFGFVAESVRHFERALDLNPSLPVLYFALAEPMAQTNNWDRAIELYQQGLALAPDDAKAHYRLALIYWRAGRPGNAKAEVEKGIAVAKNRSEVETGQALLDSH